MKRKSVLHSKEISAPLDRRHIPIDPIKVITADSSVSYSIQ